MTWNYASVLKLTLQGLQRMFSIQKNHTQDELIIIIKEIASKLEVHAETS